MNEPDERIYTNEPGDPPFLSRPAKEPAAQSMDNGTATAHDTNEPKRDQHRC